MEYNSLYEASSAMFLDFDKQLTNEVHVQFLKIFSKINTIIEYFKTTPVKKHKDLCVNDGDIFA